MHFKYFLHAIFGASLAVCCFATSAQAVTVTLAPSSISVATGGSFGVSLSISNLTGAPGDSLSGFDVNLLFDPSFLELTGFTFTDAASNSNQLALPEPGSLPFSGDVTATAGIIDAFAVSGNSASVLDAAQLNSFDFLTLTFKALSATTLTEISLDTADPGLLFLDSGSGDLAVTFGNTVTAVTITGGGNTIPAPSSLVLILLGLGTAAFMRYPRAQFNAVFTPAREKI